MRVQSVCLRPLLHLPLKQAIQNHDPPTGDTGHNNGNGCFDYKPVGQGNVVNLTVAGSILQREPSRGDGDGKDREPFERGIDDGM